MHPKNTLMVHNKLNYNLLEWPVGVLYTFKAPDILAVGEESSTVLALGKTDAWLKIK